MKISRGLLILLLNHWLFAAAAVTIMGLLGRENPHLLFFIGLGLPAAGFYAVRMKVQNFFLFFFWHLAALACGICLPADWLQKLLTGIIVLIYVIWSVKIRLTQKDMEMELISPIIIIGAMAVLSLVSAYFMDDRWQGTYVLAIGIYLIGCSLYYFLEQYLGFLAVNASTTANLPKKAIFSSGMKQILGYAAISAAVFGAAANIEWFYRLWTLIKQGILRLLRWLFSLIRWEEGEESLSVQEAETLPEEMSMIGESGESSIFWEVMEKLLLIACAVGLTVLLIWAIRKLSQYLWAKFHEEKPKRAPEEEQTLDIREDCGIERKHPAARSWLAFLDHREKIRKIYRKKVLKGKAQIIGDRAPKALEHFTARECCEKLSDGGLQKAYEKARYSEEGITAEDVKLAKNGTNVF